MAAGQLEVPEQVLAFLGQQSVVTVATASPSGVPWAGPYLYVSDGPDLFFWTRPDTTTARHVRQNPSVAFAIEAFDGDLRGLRGLQGMGECTVLLDGRRIAEVAGMFGEKYPSLAPGATMSISFFRISPVNLEYVDNSERGAHTTPGDFGASFHRERVYSVFTDLPRAALETISGTLLSQHVEAGEVLVGQGGPADKFLIVVDGEVEVVREDADGDEAVLATFGPGHFFGELSILRDRPRSASVRATRDSTLLSMDRDAFKRLVAQSLGATADFDEVVRGRLRSDDDLA